MDKSPAQWREVPLEDCMSAIIDYRGKSPNKTRSGVPLITAKVVKGGRLLDQEREFIAEEDYDIWMRRGLPEVGDVLITTEAPLGEVAQVHSARIALAQRIILLRGNPALLDNTFLKFALQSGPVQREIHARSTGTTVLGIRQSELRKVLLPVPPLREQKIIAEILGSLDDKIDLNRRMNQTLEAMAQALFRSWFVDFEPVRAKTEGRQPEAMDAATATLFPSRLVDSEMGAIPDGWAAGTLAHFASLSRTSISPFDFPDESFEHFSIPAFDAGGYPATEKGASIKSNKFLVPEGAVLIAKLNPSIPRVWLSMPSGAKRRICSTEFLVFKPCIPDAREFVWASLRDERLRQDLAGKASGTSNSHQRVSPEDVLNAPILLPPSDALRAFSKLAQPILDRMQSSIRESLTLAQLRDALLPKLLSGEIRVRDAEAQLAASA